MYMSQRDGKACWSKKERWTDLQVLLYHVEMVDTASTTAVQL